jgi:hypothetical protein
MGEFQGEIREMQNEELRLLALRDADAKRRLAETKVILVLGTIIGMMIATSAANTNLGASATARTETRRASECHACALLPQNLG